MFRVMLNSKIFGGIGAGIAILVISIVSFTFINDEQPSPAQSEVEKQSFPLGSGLGIHYTETNHQLKLILEEKDIEMSSPIKLDTPRGIWTYCNFFKGEEQKLVEFCTSTELRDADDEFLGNIHAFGTPDEPKRMMVVIQVDPFLNQKEDAKTVFSVLTDYIVCECWHEKNDEGISMDDWAEAYISSHIGAGKPSTTSNIVTLENRSIQMKLITNTEGYEWQLLIA